MRHASVGDERNDADLRIIFRFMTMASIGNIVLMPSVTAGLRKVNVADVFLNI